jgi:hypothetical protein
VSLAILGGNSFGWHARLDHHDQRLSVWRERQLDPRPGLAATVPWVALGWNPASLTGVRPVHGAPGPLRLEHAASWAWSGVAAQSRLGVVLGAEYDGSRRAGRLPIPPCSPPHGSPAAQGASRGPRPAPARRLRLQRLRARILVAARLPVAAISPLDRQTLARGVQARLSAPLTGAPAGAAPGREPHRALDRARAERMKPS